LAYFYFDHRDPRKQNLRNFAATAIAQLVKQSSSCYTQVEKWFDSRSHELNQRLPSSEYGSLLKAVAGDFARTIVVLDALDECNDLSALVQCFQELLGVLDSSSMHILATSRNDLVIERLILPLATSELSLMRNIREDIVTYVTTEVDDRVRSKRLKLRNPDLGKQIKIALLKNSDGMSVDYCSVQAFADGCLGFCVPKSSWSIYQTWDLTELLRRHSMSSHKA